MATISTHAHKDLKSFLDAIVTLAAAGDFIDGKKLSRAHYGKRPFSPFPSVPLTTVKTAPTASNAVASSGDYLYVVPFPQRFGDFLNDVQAAVATGGKFAGKTVEELILTDYSTKPLFRCNVKFAGAVVPKAKVTAAGAVQYSANGTSGWANAIPASVLTADTDVEFYVRVNPTGTTAADDGSYNYNFKMVASSAGDTGGSAIGGLNLVNDATVQNKAKISGKVIAEAGHNNKFEITITGEVVDSYGTKVSGTALKGNWS